MPNYSGMWSLSQQFQGTGQGLWPKLPTAPTIGTATGADASASVAFTAPACVGVPGGITGYTATSTPGCVTGTGASSPITVSGLTNGTAYTFKVKATNATGTGACSAASNSVTPAIVQGQQAYTTPGTYSWVAPAGVTSVSIVAVGGGGWCAYGNYRGGGGGLGYKNNFTVTPGASYSVSVGAKATAQYGGDSYFNSSATVRGGGGSAVSTFGTYTGDGGGNGGPACIGGGGAGGYSGAGGRGGNSGQTAGSGGGGGGGGAGGYYIVGCCCVFSYPAGAGGGVGLLGQGANGAAGTCRAGQYEGGPGGTGGAGSGGSGSSYGGGSGFSVNGASGNTGGGGAVRIIWPGTTRSFPSTNTGNL